MSETLENVKSTLENAGIDTQTVEKIMDKFIVADKNLILKTDLDNPIGLARLMTIQKDLERKGLKQSAKTLEIWIDSYIKCRISRNRLSRTEILDAISAIKREQTNSVLGKWLGTSDKKGDK